jgi:hypothetical protein
MNNPKILKSEYLRLSQEGLSIFSENVVKLCLSGIYIAVLTQVKALSIASDEYRVALLDAAGKERTKVYLKNEKKKALINALNLLATMLEVQPEISLTFIWGAGFKEQSDKTVVTRSKEASFEVPKIITAESTGKRGELRLELEPNKSVGFVQFAFEYSNDKGEVWHNGTYSTGSKFVWERLPSSSDLMIRSRSLGTRKRRSDWSSVQLVAVL